MLTCKCEEIFLHRLFLGFDKKCANTLEMARDV